MYRVRTPKEVRPAAAEPMNQCLLLGVNIARTLRNVRFCEGFRMPAARKMCGGIRRPASENLKGRNRPSTRAKTSPHYRLYRVFCACSNRCCCRCPPAPDLPSRSAYVDYGCGSARSRAPAPDLNSESMRDMVVPGAF
jgi:hypothetical protein